MPVRGTNCFAPGKQYYITRPVVHPHALLLLGFPQVIISHKLLFKLNPTFYNILGDVQVAKWLCKLADDLTLAGINVVSDEVH